MEEVLLCTKCYFLILDGNIVPIFGTLAVNVSNLFIPFLLAVIILVDWTEIEQIYRVEKLSKAEDHPP